MTTKTSTGKGGGIRRPSQSLAGRNGRSVRLQSVPTILDSSNASLKEPPRGLGGLPDELWQELEHVFEHLFDPSNNDHLSLEEQLAQVQQKDLYGAKFYKLAMGVFGQQRAALEMGSNRGRKRVIVAKPRAFYRGGVEDVEEEPFNAPLRPPCPKPELLSAERIAEIQRQDEIAEYKRWFAEKKSFRRQLDTFGDVDRFLDGKPDKTEEEMARYSEVLEERKKLREKKIERLRQMSSKPVQERPSSAKDKKKPGVKRPSPLALGIIDAALKKRKMRLLDLFASVDKDKSWTLSREEFQWAFDKIGIRMPPALLEDLIITLDKDNNNELDYRELSKGLEQFRIERRRTDLSIASTLDRDPSQLSSILGQSNATIMETTEAVERQTSLGPPPLDVRDERFVCDNEEAAVDLRKRDRVALRHFREKKEQQSAGSLRSMVRSGDVGFDAHNAPSSLGSDVGASVEKFRQVAFRNYMTLMRMCQEEKIVLSEPLLRRMLLYPADRPPSTIRTKIRQPGARCPVSRAQVLFDQREAARGARRAAREAQEAAERRARRRRAVNLSQVGAALPTAEELAEDREDDERVHLSTGWATVKRKVDCWLTFEEYEQLICNLPLTQHADIRLPPDNTFWPGTSLQRLRLFVEDQQFGPGAMFQPTVSPLRKAAGARGRVNWGYDNNLRATPIAADQDGRFYMTSGNIDPQLKSAVLMPRS